jgi:5-oxoprolinase (ATP-hydrolysing)
MTNTRITDPEVIETRYPWLRLERFRIRRGSGGAGKQRGGDGVVRGYRFMEDTAVSVVSERRTREPFGLAGGGPGARGENVLVSPDGSKTDLGGKVQTVVPAGSVLEIRTPGGGGFGPEDERSEKGEV